MAMCASRAIHAEPTPEDIAPLVNALQTDAQAGGQTEFENVIVLVQRLPTDPVVNADDAEQRTRCTMQCDRRELQ